MPKRASQNEFDVVRKQPAHGKIDKKVVVSDDMWATSEDDEDFYEFAEQSQFINQERWIKNATKPYGEDETNYISDELEGIFFTPDIYFTKSGKIIKSPHGL